MQLSVTSVSFPEVPLKALTKRPQFQLASTIVGSSHALEIKEEFEPLSFETAAAVTLNVTRSLEKEFQEEEEDDDDVPLTRRPTRDKCP